MKLHFLTPLLLVCGAYWIGTWIEALIATGEALLSVKHSGDVGPIGDAWLAIQFSVPRALGAVGAGALLWFAAGPDATRRWRWGLVGLFVSFGMLERVFDRPLMFNLVAGYSFFPAVACLATIWLLARRHDSSHRRYAN